MLTVVFLFPSLQTERDTWIGRINSVTGGEGASIPTRSQTLPARTDDSGKEEQKKRGFFTLKKK